MAAGKGIRLRSECEAYPKTLLSFGNTTILEHILANFASIGVPSVSIVVGCRGEVIRRYLKEQENFGLDIGVVENPRWEGGNGLSVLAGARDLAPGEYAFLSMSDHLVSPAALAAVRNHPGERSALLTDDRLDRVFDMPDATKAQVENGEIVRIGKNLTSFNAVDCGIFRINRDFVDALEAEAAEGREGISDGVRRLLDGPGMESVPLPPGSAWIDIDTPEAYRHARTMPEFLSRGASGDDGRVPLEAAAEWTDLR